jgi:SAM-dependent MidA family methyltransferase
MGRVNHGQAAFGAHDHCGSNYYWDGLAPEGGQIRNATPSRDIVTETSPLLSEIKRLIKSSGPMPVWRYMELCLVHPVHGYYVSRDPLGREGDFTTAPEVSQMFGELLGLWAASVWNAIDSPPLLRLIEIGPGRGTMMADALRALRVLPPLYQALSIHLVEINPVLRDKQKAALSGSRNITWHDTIDDVPDGPSVIFANEYFDVLPIHQAVKGENGWHERTVELDDGGRLVFGAASEPIPRFEVLLPKWVRAAPIGAVFEWRPDTEVMKIASRVRDQGGAALIIDYGHLRSDAGDTFQAIARHSFADPLKNPGQADVTAHVDFQALVRAAEDLGAGIHGPVPQGDFLKRLGIETRAISLMAKATHDVSEDVAGALKRLIGGGSSGMGQMFKVLGISEPDLTRLAGFADEKPDASAETP